MSVTVYKKTMIGIIITIIVTGLSLSAVSFYFAQDWVLSNQIRRQLEVSLKTSGLKVKLGRVRWTGWGQLRGSDLVLTDPRTGQIPFTAGRIDISLDPLRLIQNPGHPEVIISKVDLVRLHAKLIRFPDGTCNIQRYFPASKRKMVFEAPLTVRDGFIELDDYQYGVHRFSQIQGRIDLRTLSVIRYQLTGRADLNDELRWKLSGTFQTGQNWGQGTLQLQKGSVTKIMALLPSRFHYPVRSGLADLRLNFGWGNKTAWLNNGRVKMTEFQLVLAKSHETVAVNYLEGWFDPQQIKISKARLNYQGATIRATGSLRTSDMTLRATVNASRLQLEKLWQFVPCSTTTVAGLADLQLSIGGKLGHPLINGDVSLRDARVAWGKQKIDFISGRARIENNNLAIRSLEGYWGTSLVGATGTIHDVLHPQFRIDLYGHDLKPDYQSLGLTKLSQSDLVLGEADVTGRLAGSLSGVLFNGKVEFDRLKYRDLAADHVQAGLSWKSGTQVVTIHQVNGNVLGSRLVADGTIKLSPEAAEWRMSGKVANLNLAELPFYPQLKLAGNVSMDLVAHGAWHAGQNFDPGTVLGSFHGDSFAYQGIRVDQANGIFTWNQGVFSVDSLEGWIDKGHFFGQFAYSKDGIQTQLDVEDLRVRRLLPNGAAYPIDADFSGMLSFHGPIDNPTGTISGDFSHVIWDSKLIGDAKGELLYSNRELELSNFRVTTTAGDFRLLGKVAWQSEPIVHGSLASDNFKLNQFLKFFPEQPALNIDGNGSVMVTVDGSLSNPQLSGKIQLDRPSLNQFVMERGTISFAGNIKDIELKQFDLVRKDTRIQVTGHITTDAWDLQVTSNSFDLEWLNLKYTGKVLKGNVKVNGNLTGDFAHPEFAADLDGTDFSFGTYKYQHFLASIVWNSQSFAIKEAQLQQNESLLDVFGDIENAQPAQLNLGVRVISSDLQDLLQLANISGVTAEGKLSGLARITGPVDNPVVRVDAELPQGSINQIPIKGGFTLSYTNNQVNIENVHIEPEKGSLVASGMWENGQVLKLKTSLREFPLQILNPLIKPTSHLEGIVNSDVDLKWDNSKITGDYQVNIAAFTMNQSVLGELRMEGGLSGQGLAITKGQLSNKGGLLSVSGYIPWPVEMLQRFNLPMQLSRDLRDYNLQVDLKNFPADSLNFADKQFKVEKGTINGSVQMKGEIAQPLFYGKINCSSVRVSASLLPVPVDNLEASVTLQGDSLRIDSAHALYGKGHFSMNGSVGFKQNLFNPELNLLFNGNRIYYRNLFFDGYSDLDVSMLGTLEHPVIRGNITLSNGKIGILGVQNKKNSASLWSPELDLAIKAGKNIRYRQYGLADVAVEGQITMKGPLNNLAINGTAQSKTGVLTVYGQSFKVNKATAVFKDSQGFTPYIDVDSSLKTSKVEVFLSVKGQIGENLSYNLSSQPYLSQSELFAALNWSDLNGEEPLTMDGVVSGNLSIVTDTLFGDAFYEIRRALGVDYFYLEQDYRDRKFRINVGDYITDQLFLSYSRSVNDESDDVWGLDYQLTPKLLAGSTYSYTEGTSYRLMYRIHF